MGYLDVRVRTSGEGESGRCFWRAVAGEAEGDSRREEEEVGVEGGGVDWIEDVEVREDSVGERV